MHSLQAAPHLTLRDWLSGGSEPSRIWCLPGPHLTPWPHLLPLSSYNPLYFLSLNRLSSFLPQGICTSWSLCLKCSFLGSAHDWPILSLGSYVTSSMWSSPDHPIQSRPPVTLTHHPVDVLYSIVSISSSHTQLSASFHQNVMSVRAEPHLIAHCCLPKAQNSALHRTGPQFIFDDWLNI